jgi:hypothetical protein
MLDFFQERTEYMHQLNLSWINHLLKNDDLDVPQEIGLVISKILNNGHIWVCRLSGVHPESELNDLQPEMHWLALETDNALAWSSYFLSLENGIFHAKHPSEKVDFEQEIAVLLFQSLKENAYFIGQLQLLCDQYKIPAFDERFIVLG